MTTAPADSLGAIIPMETHYEIEQFLYREARLLDERRFGEWIELFAEDARYVMPVRLNREDGAAWESHSKSFDDTRQTLAIRVNRLSTEYAWAEQPPSRVRHFITNVITETTPESGELIARSNELIYRSRGDVTDFNIISAQRVDRVRRADAGWKIAHRWVALDQSTLSTHNLSMFF
ncbi:3-phenylpropionate/cinnamic acid dioxygenase subunit beta [Mycobacterium sp. E2479]|uniref:aromatic-ring-hydroxylating dioxygenase subunit beta n=1 Tax=Mycobacterium sp. E2479 TaxID=1834134 RepID=UPI000A8FEA36|nr:3-phenylpropionate/cinnamic acid dioxygenase subunit beta [Mycobacterium sp. E2479]